MATRNDINPNTQTTLAEWIPEIWSRRVYEEARAKYFWARFSGPEGSGMPLIEKRELLTNPGDTIHVSQQANLTGAGVSGDTALEGNEEELSLKEVSLSPTWYRHAVAINRPASKQINQNFRERAMSGLSDWMAKKMDTAVWTASRTTAATGFESSVINVVYGNDATSVDTIDSADDFGVTEIRKAAATLGNNNIAKVRTPDMPAGMGYYLMFVHPWQAYSLKGDTEWIDRHENAAERGATNPLFTGALGVIDGVIIHETTQCTRAQNANSPVVYYARAVCVGQEALAVGLNQRIMWREQMTDFEYKQGIAVEAAWEVKVMTGNAIVQVVTAAVDPNA